jgi:hypothetical protein
MPDGMQSLDGRMTLTNHPSKRLSSMSRILVSSKRSLLAAPAYIPFMVKANTLTRLIPDLYAALDVVSRELVGMIPSVTRNVSAERAALGEAVVWPKSPSASLFQVTPSMTIPEPADRTYGNDTITITRSEGCEFGWTGEEQKGLNNGAGFNVIAADDFMQALRTLTNAIERDLMIEASNNASAATGTAGTTPFATNLADSAQVRKLLDDNGAPLSDRSLVIDTAAGANLRTLGNLSKVNEAGTAMTLRDGELLNLHGFSIKESGQADAAIRMTSGTAAGATTNTAGYAKGATTITLASAGTGTILAGDYIRFAGDSRAYRVVTGDADVSNGGTVVLAAPGLMHPIGTAATAITVVSATGGYSRNVAFARHAMQLVARAPALPEGGDAAEDRYMLVDPRSGMAFEVAVYKGYRKARFEVTCAWGVKAAKSEHIALLLG